MRVLGVTGCLALAGLLVSCAEQGTQLTEPTDSPLFARGGNGGVVEMVTGSGHFVTRPPALTPGVWRTFSMNARKLGDGSVRGQFQRVGHPQGEAAQMAHGTISCFTILGNTAWIGGHLPGNSPTDVVWQVVDNGEEAGDPPDQVGLQIAAATFGFEAGFAQDFCDNTPTVLDFGPPFGELPVAVVLSPIAGGNIQIMVK